MRVDIHTGEFELTPQLRHYVESTACAAGDRPRGAGIGRHDEGVLEIALDDNQITQQLREWLERPENYLRPIRVRERWKIGGVDRTVPEEAETPRAK